MKKILSVLLVTLLLFSVASISVFATDWPTAEFDIDFVPNDYQDDMQEGYTRYTITANVDITGTLSRTVGAGTPATRTTNLFGVMEIYMSAPASDDITHEWTYSADDGETFDLATKYGYDGITNKIEWAFNTDSQANYYPTGTASVTKENPTLYVMKADVIAKDGSSLTITPEIKYINATYRGSSNTAYEDSGYIVGTPVTLNFGEAAATTYTVAYDLAGGNGTAEGGEVEEGTEITLPAAPTKAGYTFKGWNDGTTTYAAGASYTVNANVTFTAEWEEVVVADPTVDTATVSEGYTTVSGTNGTIYNNVWVGEYSATPETGAALTSMTVSFKDGAKVFNVADHKTVEGEATLEFSIALIGVPTSENLAGTVAATAAWVN